MRIAICDDQSVFLAQLQSALASWPDRPPATVVEVFEDGDALIHAHTVAPFDIILLDVVMPLLNGIETARELRQQDKTVKIVFLTSSAEFAVDSYSVKASNYILKPLDVSRLYLCLNELTDDIRSRARSITAKCSNCLQRIELNSIEYLEAQNKHVLFVLSDGRTVSSTEPLYAFKPRLLLEDGFFQCSRSYIVNIHLIETYTPKEIIMRSGCRISISRNCQKEFEDAYFSLLFGKAGDR